MTTADRYVEIGRRITRLTELHADLVAANAKLQKLVADAKQARAQPETAQSLQNTATPPTPEEFRAALDAVNSIKASAEEVVAALRGLGCDPGLFEPAAD